MTENAWAASQSARALVFVDQIRDDEIGRPEIRVDDAAIWIDGPDGHHLQRVRRLAVDESIVVADGEGLWYPARVAQTRPGAVMVEPVGGPRLEPVLRPGLSVAFAPAKRDHGTEVVHQLVELGVDRIIPLISARAMVRWDGDRGVKALDRLRRVVREAAMQCHRARLPVVDPPTRVADVHDSESLLIGDPRGCDVNELAEPADGEWIVIVGPEGGFAPTELGRLDHAARVRVGPHILRSVTAPVAIAAALATRRRS